MQKANGFLLKSLTLKPRQMSPFLTQPTILPTVLLWGSPKTKIMPLGPLNDLLNSITSVSDLKRVHARLLILGLFEHHNLPLATKLLFLASLLSPTLSYARHLFDAIPYPDSFASNTLIRACAVRGPCSDVPSLYAAMRRAGLSPDPFTFPSVVRSCAVLSAAREGRQAHCDAAKHGLASSVFMQSALLTFYSQCGDIHGAELVFNEMEAKNTVSWTAMIAGYAQNAIFRKALEVFKRMAASGERPSEVTLVSVLPVCRSSDYLYLGESMHVMVIKMGLDSYLPLANALIAMYGKCGRMEVARLLFDKMGDRSRVSWNTMIATYEQRGAGDKAVRLFRRMVAEKVRFDSVTLVSVISACANLGALDTGRWVHGLARSSGLESDVRVGNALLDMYAKCGSVSSARDVFEKLSWRGVVSWSAMIRAYAAHGHAEEALALLSRMTSEGVKPNSFTYTSILAACSHSGLVEEGMRHFESMREDYEITPTVEHCACMVDLFGRAGRLNEAYEFIKKMPIEPDTGVWGALLGACRMHGDLELAECVVEDLFRSDHRNVTYYVLMSNIYADVGRWEDAERLRKLMKELELKKAPGSSLVETDKKPRRVLFLR